MTSHQYDGWWAGPADDRYPLGPYSTREEASAALLGMHPEGGYIVQATQYGDRGYIQLVDHVDGESLLEEMDHGLLQDLDIGDGDGLYHELTREQREAFDVAITAAIRKWQQDTGARIYAGRFQASSAPERITATRITALESALEEMLPVIRSLAGIGTEYVARPDLFEQLKRWDALLGQRSQSHNPQSENHTQYDFSSGQNSH